MVKSIKTNKALQNTTLVMNTHEMFQQAIDQNTGQCAKDQ